MRKLLMVLICCSPLIAQQQGDGQKSSRMSSRCPCGYRRRARVRSPLCQSPLYKAMYDSAVSEFARLLREECLLDELTTPVTIFAPVNAKLRMQKLRNMGRSAVRDFIRRHIVPGYIVPKTLADGAELRNLHGEDLALTRDDDDELYIADVRIYRHRETPHAVLYHIAQPLDD